MSTALWRRARALLVLVGAPALAGAEPTLAQRQAAAQLTADQSPACAAVRPFYWEVGDATQPLARGSVGERAPGRSTELPIASASKWLYAAFVAERRQSQLTAEDVKFLHFQSGYTHFRVCRPGQSIAACQASLLSGRGRQDPATENRFAYGGGHMRQHALQMGLGEADADGLARR